MLIVFIGLLKQQAEPLLGGLGDRCGQRYTKKGQYYLRFVS